MAFRCLDIFVFSGTGNTYKAAQCIGKAANGMGVDYTIGMIDVNSKPEEYKPSSDRLLGLMAPTIGAIQPMSFFGFMCRLPKGNEQNVFLASTGAWSKKGPVIIPGYVGFGLYLAALILLIKGYRIVGITGFGMPRNWTTLIPPDKKELENRINEELSVAAGKFSADILSGKRIYKRITDLIITLLIFPLPILYLMFGRLFLAKTMFAGSDCSGCMQCAASCPRNAIKMYGKRKKRPYWTYKCEQCMRCAGYCPRKAVDCNSFLVLAFIVLFGTIPVEMIITNALNRIYAFSSISGYKITLFIAYYIAILLLGAAIYTLFYLLSRIPLVSKIFTCLSFTHYWRKYRHKEVEIKVLSGTSARKQK